MPRRAAPGRSCLECRRRKIKCDRSFPCGYCVKIRHRCQYPTLDVIKIPQSHSSTTHSTANVHVEDTVEPLNDLDRGPASVGQLVRLSSSGQSQAHGSGPVKPVQYVLQPSRSNHLPPHPLLTPSTFPFDIKFSASLVDLHPSSAEVTFLWQNYLDVVDPVLKLFHIPTVQRRIMDFVRCPSDIDTPTECLLFAIYYATITAMPIETCRTNFHEDKVHLLKRYRSGVEQSLCRANFLRSRDITVLQAFVLYMAFARHDPQGANVCPLIGIAVGNAMIIGLDNEKNAHALSPFDLEFRRRLWWQIFVLDAHIAMDHGVEPIIFDPIPDVEKPLNVNDINLNPSMVKLPESQQGKTEMLFTLIHLHTGELARRILCTANTQKPSLTRTEALEMIELVQNNMEKEYVTHCDVCIPLDFVTLVLTRLTFLKLRATKCSPLADATKGIARRPHYGNMCRDILRQSHSLRQFGNGNPQWLWLLGQCVEWNSLAYCLLETCLSMTWDVARAMVWQLIEKTYNDCKMDPDVVQDRRWSRIDYLYTQAQVAKERMQSEHGETLLVPDPSTDQAIPAATISISSSEETEDLNLARAGMDCSWSASILKHYLDITSPEGT
ncbi:fungal-specific transcription factor [Dactylonectria macrodidyma]|uniref:Fungal-specific transcription factor n=1 Tax=Dactylonectria macrodidyma TaxID=307937 RepID=A0A9P9E5J8_9HYPO|nr:fungal-specific transcription factor [Dactylonectria macrodidyma]